jgi:uncharacterized membrane protein
MRAIRHWLFSGNLVAKLGLLILFIGVSFLLKYAAERVTVPIEMRLAGIVMADIALLSWGWRLRLSRPGISLPIQGAGLAILMLVTFGAFRLYQLIPSSLAFGLLFVLTAFTCILAVLQNAFWLAAFGITGGFLAPILTSTGQGSHVALFSYYALLNAGVLAIALKRTWRPLNLLGFGFTFLIGAAWGVLRYSPDHDYLSAQLFLLLFFVYYVAISVVYGLRRSVALKAYVDATLVFGTPLSAFALQFGLMRHVEFGHAWSALGFGLFYTALALGLWRRRGAGMHMLVEAFLALGVVFGTLAIPFALDGRWTSAAWALEGAGVAWVALRQRQRLALWFGMLVQAGAWISFIGSASGLSGASARDANLWLGFLILAVSAFFMAITLRKHQADSARMASASSAFLAGAALWLLAGAWTEISLRLHGATMLNLLAASALAVATILALIALRMKWPRAGVFSLVAQMAAGAILLLLSASSWDWTQPSSDLFAHPLAGALMICAAALFTSWKTDRMPLEDGLKTVSQFMLGWAAFWWFGPILNTLAGYLALRVLPDSHLPTLASTQEALVYALAAVTALAAAAAARRLPWRTARWLSTAAWIALALMHADMLASLYDDAVLPGVAAWIALGLVWASSEFLLHAWRRNDWHLHELALQFIHLVRSAGPWIMLWKAGQLAIGSWLAETQGGSMASASWANFIPAWIMMAVAAWVAARASKDRWPTTPLASWYRGTLIPVASILSLLLVGAWNLLQDGSMAPLPYLPVLNPLDLTTAFALALAAFTYRMVSSDERLLARHAGLLARLPPAGIVATYVWFNLILLRTAAHAFGVGYRLDALYESLIVQAMLSLVWSVTALVLMRRAALRASRRGWMIGAALLAVVVAKLFMIDLDGSGSVARIVSFVGVGLLMVLIGYLAPYPNHAGNADAASSPQGA